MKENMIKAKFLCRSTVTLGNKTIVFSEGKWYDGVYEEWQKPYLFKLNGGHKRFWVTNNFNERVEISKAEFNLIFSNMVELREFKINQILDI